VAEILLGRADVIFDNMFSDPPFCLEFVDIARRSIMSGAIIMAPDNI